MKMASFVEMLIMMAVAPLASHITPGLVELVPMTITMLMEQTYQAAPNTKQDWKK